MELHGYDLTFFCLDLINTACVRVCRTPSASYLIVYQAEDRDFEKLHAVFQALTVSLLKESSVKTRLSANKKGPAGGARSPIEPLNREKLARPLSGSCRRQTLATWPKIHGASIVR